MSYVDGYVLAVPKASRARFIEYAETVDQIFIEYGATRVIECWADDVPEGNQTDFYKAVQTKDDETVVFSWVEWPDKETRDTGMAEMEGAMKTNDLFNQEKNPMPFDGLRMIYGSFQPVVDIRGAGSD